MSITVTIPGYMIDHEQALKIIKAMGKSDVYLKSELTIKSTDDKLQLGILYGTTLDLEQRTLDALARIAYESVSSARQSAIELHIHTFSCPTCPDFIKASDCVSDG